MTSKEKWDKYVEIHDLSKGCRLTDAQLNRLDTMLHRPFNEWGDDLKAAFNTSGRTIDELQDYAESQIIARWKGDFPSPEK